MSTPLRTGLSLTLASLFFAVLALGGSSALHAQNPAETMADELDNANTDAPETLNTAQQARMKLAGAKRSVSKAEKFEKKELAEKNEEKRKELHDQAKEAYEEAIAEYRSAIQLDPKLVDGWIGLATMMAKAGRHDLAIQTFDKALELRPDDTDALAGKGRSQLAGFKVADAQATYERLVAVSAKAGRGFLGEMRAWLEATRPRLGPEMAQAVSDLDAWISAREKK